MATLDLKIEGKKGSISFDHFLIIMRNSFDILKDLDSAISLQPKGSLDWLVTKLSVNCLSVEISSTPKIANIDYGQRVVDEYLGGMKILNEEGRTPPYFSETCLNRLLKIAHSFGSNGAESLELQDPLKKEIVTKLDKKIGETAIQLMGKKYQAYGAIEGTLEMISIHTPPRFNIYHNVFLRAVRCNLPSERQKEVIESLGRRVIASGLVSYNMKDEPISVKLEELEVIPTEEQLPTIDQFIGSDPDFTGNMTTGEYIRSIRNA